MGSKLRKERFFTVELESKLSLRNITLADEGNEGVLVEGTLGELMEARFAEDTVLEVKGSEGVLRIDLAQSEIARTSGGGRR